MAIESTAQLTEIYRKSVTDIKLDLIFLIKYKPLEILTKKFESELLGELNIA